MAKKATGSVKLQVAAGKATPAPPVGPALGQAQVNIMEFCKQFNARTSQKELEGLIIPVVITVYSDRTFTFITKTPPASILLKRAAGIAKGSGAPNKDKVGKVTAKQVEDIAKQKMPDLNAATVDSAIKSIRSTARARGTVVLPHGLGKSKKVLVIASGDKIREAEAAGADFVGGEDMVEKITKENWTDFDALIATPDMMKSVGRLGKVLGPKGLMPNPKTGTVTIDVARAVQEVKAGKVEFRTDKTALVHVPVGKISFTPDKLIDNATTLISSVIKAKPAVAKGKYIKGCYLSSSMGPGISLDTTAIETASKA